MTTTERPDATMQELGLAIVSATQKMNRILTHYNGKSYIIEPKKYFAQLVAEEIAHQQLCKEFNGRRK